VAPQSFGIYVAKLAGVNVGLNLRLYFLLGPCFGDRREEIGAIQFED
jgi:hypothetical protein